MRPNERVKQLRKEILHLTQEEFSKAIKISRSNLGNIETGKVSLTDRVIYDISNTYSINENWIRTGTGNIYEALTTSDLAANICGKLLKTDNNVIMECLIELESLSPAEWNAVKDFIKTIKNLRD